MIIRSLIFLFLLSACSPNTMQSAEDGVRFGDLVELENVSEVRVRNNNGYHEVKGDTRKELIELLGNMTLEKNGSYKTGAKSIELTIGGDTFALFGRTHGNYIEADRKIVSRNKESIEGIETLYFKADKLNIDNY